MSRHNNVKNIYIYFSQKILSDFPAIPLNVPWLSLSPYYIARGEIKIMPKKSQFLLPCTFFVRNNWQKITASLEWILIDFDFLIFIHHVKT